MSTVIHPRGPLSPRVYWTRRILLVALVMVVVAVLWWMLGVGGTGNASADPGATPPTGPNAAGQETTGGHPETSAPHPSAPATNGGTRTGGAEPSQPATTHPTTTKEPDDHAAPRRLALPPPSGPCDPTAVTLAVVVDSAPEGDGTTVGLRMSTEDGTSCTLGISPSLLETRITSGDVIVWQSGSCPDALPAKNVVVRPKPALVYSYGWDGQINPDSCSDTNRVAAPGWYWAEAALIGGEPTKTQFQVTSTS